jgi:hypothetical protein
VRVGGEGLAENYSFSLKLDRQILSLFFDVIRSDFSELDNALVNLTCLVHFTADLFVGNVSSPRGSGHGADGNGQRDFNCDVIGSVTNLELDVKEALYREDEGRERSCIGNLFWILSLFERERGTISLESMKG